MKCFFSILLLFFLISCSAPRYTYRFPASPSASADKLFVDDHQPPAKSESAGDLVASSDAKVFVELSPQPVKNSAQLTSDRPAAKAMNAIRKTAQRTKEELRSVVVPDPASLDEDLKLAILFGVVGMVSLVLLILSKLFGIIGGIALIIATVYFVKWFLAQ